MKKVIGCVLWFVVALPGAVNGYGSEKKPPSIKFCCAGKFSPARQDQDIAAQVKKAFDEVRKNRRGQTYLKG